MKDKDYTYAQPGVSMNTASHDVTGGLKVRARKDGEQGKVSFVVLHWWLGFGIRQIQITYDVEFQTTNANQKLHRWVKEFCVMYSYPFPSYLPCILTKLSGPCRNIIK